MALGQLSPRKIVPNPKTNPNPNRGAIFLRGNCPDTSKDVSRTALILEILNTLEFMHSIGYIHRYIKPNNITIHSNIPILIAFDKAKQYLDKNGKHLPSLSESPVGTQACSTNREIFLE